MAGFLLVSLSGHSKRRPKKSTPRVVPFWCLNISFERCSASWKGAHEKSRNTQGTGGVQARLATELFVVGFRREIGDQAGFEHVFCWSLSNVVIVRWRWFGSGKGHLNNMMFYSEHAM